MGITNQGTIASSLKVVYFDMPMPFEIECPETVATNTEIVVGLGGYPGWLFRVEWGDGSASESNQEGYFSHVYQETA